MPSVLTDVQMEVYFPDHYATTKRQPERDYFWGIVFGVKPAYGKALLMSATNQRNQPQEGRPDDPISQIVIQKDILAKMLAAPLFTGKCISATRHV